MASPRTEQKYVYSYRVRADDPTVPSFGADRDEVQMFVNASLGLLTGGCELCEFAHRNNSPAMFCEKKKSPVNWGSPRCEQFVRASAQPQLIQ
jgi:hypothetical protein